jgi:hypothetical protein
LIDIHLFDRGGLLEALRQVQHTYPAYYKFLPALNQDGLENENTQLQYPISTKLKLMIQIKLNEVISLILVAKDSCYLIEDVYDTIQKSRRK